MARTTSALVQGVLQNDYGNDLNATPDLTPFITTAFTIVNRVKTAASVAGFSLSDTGQDSECELIERWLAAHCYVMSDRTYKARSEDAATAQFDGVSGMRLEATFYGQMAMVVDVSGQLQILSDRQVVSGGLTAGGTTARGFWAGSDPEMGAYSTVDN